MIDIKRGDLVSFEYGSKNVVFIVMVCDVAKDGFAGRNYFIIGDNYTRFLNEHVRNIKKYNNETTKVVKILDFLSQHGVSFSATDNTPLAKSLIIAVRDEIVKSMPDKDVTFLGDNVLITEKDLSAVVINPYNGRGNHSVTVKKQNGNFLEVYITDKFVRFFVSNNVYTFQTVCNQDDFNKRDVKALEEVLKKFIEG
jgi:hypothetical protein